MCEGLRYFFLCLGIALLLSSCLIIPGIAFADAKEHFDCTLFCQQGCGGQNQCYQACIPQCDKYKAECSLDCFNCGGPTSPSDKSGQFCQERSGTPVGSIM